MIYGIILAAGESRRMGKVKLTLPLGDKKLIEWVLEAAQRSSLDKVILVIRPEDVEIFKLGENYGAEIVLNPDFRQGMSTSIKAALSRLNLTEPEAGGFILILGDQPLIDFQIINKLIESFSPGKGEIIVPYFRNRRGNPVLFDLCWKDALVKVSGDEGGRVIIKTHPDKVKRINISSPAILWDIDEEKDYLKIQTYLQYWQGAENRKEKRRTELE